MKRYLLLAVLVVLLVSTLCAGPIPAVAQDGGECDIQLAAAIGLLAQAQAMVDAGNTTAALNLLAQASAEIARIRIECGVSPEAVLPGGAGAAPTTSANRTRLVMLGSPDAYSQLAGLAFINSIDLTLMEDRAEFIAALQEPDIAGAIHASWDVDGPILAAYADFVEGGGRLLLFYGERWVEQNRLLQQLFDVSVGLEDAGLQEGGTFLYSVEMLPSWLDDLTIGTIREDSRTLIYFASHLLTPNISGDAGDIGSSTGGARRLAVYASDAGVLYWPVLTYLIPREQTGFDPYFLADTYLGRFDNEAAAVRVLNYLLGR
ncbi:MAG: hypothetical protein JW910_09670 [Anaerolineae bacterium]|nr:hypothetical protein [Anaerolineae bacterium]